MSIELKPCPFCGSKNKQKFTVDRAWHNSFVRCWNCNATGPWMYKGHGARAAWNRRAPSLREPRGGKEDRP